MTELTGCCPMQWAVPYQWWVTRDVPAIPRSTTSIVSIEWTQVRDLRSIAVISSVELRSCKRADQLRVTALSSVGNIGQNWKNHRTHNNWQLSIEAARVIGESDICIGAGSGRWGLQNTNIVLQSRNSFSSVAVSQNAVSSEVILNYQDINQ